MSLHVQETYTVPETTASVARAVFPKVNLYLTLFDTFGSLFADPDYTALFPNNGQPALSPVQLILILILRFMEGRSICRLRTQCGHELTGNTCCVWN